MIGSNKLYLLHTQPNSQRLASWAARHKLVAPDQGDFGYALHGLLRAAFGDKAPRQFRYTDPKQGLLAYTVLGPEEFAQQSALVDPDVAAALGLDSTADYEGYRLRLMPSSWPEGFVLGFELRVRPTIRENGSGRERDAFLAAIAKNPDAQLERATVYVQWLREQLMGRADGARQAWHGAAEVLDAQVESFRLLDVVRRTQSTKEGNDRKRRVLTGPDLILSGRLRVTDATAFANLLARGVGRHRAFGLGMLLLRPGA
jgi:CRISPR system Cascade subunit CasE